jgi:hypothetical protein
MTAIDRRELLTGLAAAAVVPILPAIAPVPAVVESDASAWLRAWVTAHQQREALQVLNAGASLADPRPRVPRLP